jgi:hypothetical protein
MKRGAKPKPEYLRVIDGTARGDRAVTLEGQAIPAPPRPKHLKGRAAKVWDEMVARHPEFTEFQFTVLESYCQLKAEHETGAKTMPTARIVELRRQAELLLAPRGLPSGEGKKRDKAEDYFAG